MDITLTGSDLDTGDTLDFAIASQPAHGSVSLSGAVATYTPEANYNGADSFTFTANDGTADSAPALVSLTVSPVNDAPSAIAGSATVNEDGTVDITLTGSDIDTGDTLGFAVASQPAHGSVTLLGAVATYTPEANYNGADSFTFTANDGTADSAPALVSLTVSPVNDAPSAIAGSATVSEDGTVDITLTGSDIDTGDTLGFAVASQPAHGSVTLSGAVATYTPEANYNGADSFTFTVSDGTADSAPALVSLTVSPVNDAPSAIAGSATVSEDGTVDITLAGSDIDTGDTLGFAIASQPAHGSVTLLGAVATYTPEANYNGVDSFTFTANDGTADSAPALVSLTVSPVNDAPSAIAGSATVNEDGTVDITLAGSDIDTGDTLGFAIASQPAHGSVSLLGAVATYTPEANYNGVDSFTFTANDGTADSAPALVSLTVSPVNDAPSAIAGSATVSEDGTVDITLAGSDIDTGDTLGFAIASQPAHGSVSLLGAVATYTPESNYNGVDSFTFTANDGTADSAPALVSLTVSPVNDAPSAIAGSATVSEDGTVDITLTGSDIDTGDTLGFAIASQPAHGSVSLLGAVATYTPQSNYSGPDSFTFTVNDGTENSLPATVEIMVNNVAVNDFTRWLAEHGLVAEPGADSDHDSINNAVEYVIGGIPENRMDVNLLPTVSPVVADPDANGVNSDYLLFTYRRTDRAKNDASTTIKVEWSTDLAGQWANAVETSGVVVVEENDGFEPGVDRVKVYLPRSLAVNGKLFARLGVSIDVMPVNDPPVAQNQAVTVNKNGTVDITLTGSDVDGDVLTFAMASAPAHGSVILLGAVATYTPQSNYSGPDSFTFTVNDGTENSLPATVEIMVNNVAVNDFTRWLAEHGLVAEPGADSDHDSINNAVEYVIGGIPENRMDVNLLPTVSPVVADPDANGVNSDYLLFTYRRTDRAKNDASTTIKVEWSTDLAGQWANAVETSGVVVVEENDGFEPGVDRVKVYLPRSLAVNGKLFARLGVSIDVMPVNDPLWRKKIRRSRSTKTARWTSRSPAVMSMATC